MNSVPKMRSAFAKFCFIFTVCLVASSTVTAQVSLRRALDFDGDNKADMAVFREGNTAAVSGVWYILKSAGGITTTNFGLSTDDTFTPGDYDGDGKADICVWRDSNGTFYFLRSSNGTFGLQQWGTSGDVPVARNWDSDARTDFAVVRRTPGPNGLMNWYILNSSNGSFRAEQFGVADDFMAPGDYDGDGRFDLAVQRTNTANNTGIFYMLQSTAGFKGVAWGASNDSVAPGDYDGDGKTDIAVVRDVNGTLVWYILASRDGYIATGFGATLTDIIVQGDYDGDGKTDVAVWRDTNGTFYVLNSSNRTISGVPWGTSGDQPIANYDTH